MLHVFLSSGVMCASAMDVGRVSTGQKESAQANIIYNIT